MVIAETERLILRQFNWNDLDNLIAIKSDPQVMKYIGAGTPLTPEQVRELLGRWIEDGEYRWSAQRLQRVPQLGRAIERKAHFSAWAVIEKTTGELIGRCGLHAWNLDGQLEVEVGYVLARRFWGHGFATEAALTVRDYGMDRLGFDRLIAIILPQNTASQRVARKMGMQPEKDTTVNDLPVNLFSITRARRDELI